MVEKKTYPRNRAVALTFRVSEKEYSLIKKRMADLDTVNIRAYLLKMALEGRIINVRLDSVREMVDKLTEATDNISRLANIAAENGSLYSTDIDELSDNYEGLWEQMKEILRRLSVL